MHSPIQVLHEAQGAALYRDLPDIEYYDRDWAKWKTLSKEEQAAAIKNDTVPETKKNRRPRTEDVEVFMFPQTWGSTALGYGGLGGSAMTTDYTVLVMCRNLGCVYFGGSQLAYKLDLQKSSDEGRKKFLEDLFSHQIASVLDKGRYL
jgi:hypothetical protein